MRPVQVVGRDTKDDLGLDVRFIGVNKGFNFCDNSPGAYWMGSPGWSLSRASAELDIMKSWGCNFLRVHEAYDYWINNDLDTVSGMGHRDIIRALAQLCDQKGIYFLLDGYSATHYGQIGYRQDPLPWPPYTLRSDIISSPQDWINVWAGIAAALKDYPNTMVEPHNEPWGPEDEWFTNLQSCIYAIRTSGFTNPIVYQYGYGTDVGGQVNLDGPQPSFSSGPLGWVGRHNLSDTLSNLIPSSHQYRFWRQLGRYFYSRPNTYLSDPSTYDEVLKAETYIGLPYIRNTLNKPFLIGEVGANRWWEGADWDAEGNAFTNQLRVFKELGIHIGAWWFRAYGEYGLITSDSSPQPTKAGVIVRDSFLGYPPKHTLNINSSPSGVPFSIRKL